jgi:hypothetical protein
MHCLHDRDKFTIQSINSLNYLNIQAYSGHIDLSIKHFPFSSIIILSIYHRYNLSPRVLMESLFQSARNILSRSH